MKTRLTPTARDLLRSLRGAGPGGVAEHRFFVAVSTARQLDAVARALLELERRGFIRKLTKREDPSPGARETVWALVQKDPAMSPAPWAVSSEKGAFYIHPDGSPGVLAKVYRRGDARLIRTAPELLRGARLWLDALKEGEVDGREAARLVEEAERSIRRAVRQATRGPP